MHREKDIIVVFSVLLFIGAFKVGLAQEILPLTTDIQVDDPTTQASEVLYPAVAGNGSNAVLVAWAEARQEGVYEIYGRLYEEDSTALGDPFLIDATSSVSGNIDIAVNENGHFIVVWEVRQNETDYRIYAQVITAEGTKIGNKFQVEESPNDAKIARSPSIATTQDGDRAMIAWIENNQRVVGRIFEFTTSGELRAKTTREFYIDSEDNNPDLLAYTPNVTGSDNFVVTWVDNRSDTNMVYARQYTDDGDFFSDDFRVNADIPPGPDLLSSPAVILEGPSDNMIFCWNDGRRLEQENVHYVYSRSFDWNRNVLSNDVPIDSCSANDEPVMGIDSNGIYTFLFSQNLNLPYRFDYVYAKRYQSSYQIFQEKVIINQTKSSTKVQYNTDQEIFVLPNGNFFSVWNYNTYVDTTPSTGVLYLKIYGENPVTPPTNLTAQTVGTNSVTWHWEWNGDEPQNTNFRFKDEDGDFVSDLLPANDFTWPEESLIPNMQITRQVVAIRAPFESSPSNSVTLYTRAVTPSNLQLRDSTTTSLQITWDCEHAFRFAIERADEIYGQPDQWEYIVEWDDNLKTTHYEDNNLEPSTTYFYRVKAFNGDSVETSTTPPMAFTTPKIKMEPPSLLRVTAFTDSTIQWLWQDNANNESGYLLLDENNEPVSEILQPNTGQYLETNLKPNFLYHRKVVCVDNKNNYSDTSNVVHKATYASPPYSLHVSETSDRKVTITWTIILSASAFHIKRAETADGEWQTLKNWADRYQLSSYTDENLTPNTTYWYSVQSYNQEGELNPENSVISATTTEFIPPSDFWGEASGTMDITWRWQDNSDNEAGFYVVSGKGDTLSPLQGANIESWTETNLTANTEFIRAVMAVSTTGEQLSISNSDTVFTLAFSPTRLMITDSTSTSVELQWQGNGGTRFMVERGVNSTSDTLKWEIIAAWANALVDTQFMDTGLEPGTYYAYRVRAYNGDQILTTSSNVVALTTSASALPPPKAFTGIAASEAQINWTWIDDSDTEAGFLLRDEQQNPVSGNLPENTTSWNETGLKINTKYSRQVFAVNQDGVESGGSNMVILYTLAIPPTQIKYSRFEDKITLQWRRNNGSYFDVQRAPDEDGRPNGWENAISALRDTSFQDDNLPANKSYWYRLYAYNGDSIRTAESSESVFVPTGTVKIVKGDLNRNLVLDFQDLERLLEIVLQKGDSVTAQEAFIANYYDEDEDIDINDIIALVDTLLTSPNLFRSTGEAPGTANLARLEPTNNLQFDGAQLSIQGVTNYHSLALELEMNPPRKEAIQAVFEPNQTNLIATSRTIDNKFRLIASQVQPARNDRENKIRVFLVSNTSEKIDIRISNAMVITTDNKLIQLNADNTKFVMEAVAPPSEYKLLQNYPNPFNAQTEIRFFCPAKPLKVSLVIYNLLGQKIITLVDNQELSGFQKVKWEGKDALGQDVPSGIYLYHLLMNEQRFSKKLILLR